MPELGENKDKDDVERRSLKITAGFPITFYWTVGPLGKPLEIEGDGPHRLLVG
jgi:hypothetical protein